MRVSWNFINEASRFSFLSLGRKVLCVARIVSAIALSVFAGIASSQPPIALLSGIGAFLFLFGDSTRRPGVASRYPAVILEEDLPRHIPRQQAVVYPPASRHPGAPAARPRAIVPGDGLPRHVPGQEASASAVQSSSAAPSPSDHPGTGDGLPRHVVERKARLANAVQGADGQDRVVPGSGRRN
ncbi:MAG: hypothetical protein A3E80_06060 [Chlamydiae bacterium RIFCSPHIGHO2_12_FULL_49_9]|nr:MAG: hypothetical protein A3E80_06060 [Chlamydiae bacterium RIFCSPHIGHO2_12_FULL_49_9]